MFVLGLVSIAIAISIAGASAYAPRHIATLERSAGAFLILGFALLGAAVPML